ncbi:MAG: PHP domain-containing protein [Candidatus Aminicenantes bacterium]|nr:MAG: PHP domain-containing protein [Candidatus Aminicenantes bacterium]
MPSPIDLHIHSSKSSDGDFSPFHIVQLAKEKKMKAISITDHDTVAAYPETLRYGKEAGVEIIPSMELTTIFEEREFHLLLPFIEWKSKIVSNLISQVAKRRVKEARGRVEKLQALGFDITWKEVQKEAGAFPPLGISIAQILLRKVEADKDQNSTLGKYLEENNRPLAPYYFYKDYFMEGKPASVPRQNISILDVLDIISQTGAVPVLAHPGAYFQNVKRQDLVALKERGLQGLEVYTSYHSSEQSELYLQMALELDLVPTAGSDFHGTIKPQIPFGILNNGAYWMVEELRKRRP